MLRGHDVDRINRFVGEQLAVIDEGLGLVAPNGLHAILRARDVALIGIADRRDLDFIGGCRMQPVQARVATRADADLAHIHFVIRALSRNYGRACGNRGRLQKTTPIEFVRHGTSKFLDTQMIAAGSSVYDRVEAS